MKLFPKSQPWASKMHDMDGLVIAVVEDPAGLVSEMESILSGLNSQYKECPEGEVKVQLGRNILRVSLALEDIRLEPDQWDRRTTIERRNMEVKSKPLEFTGYAGITPSEILAENVEELTKTIKQLIPAKPKTIKDKVIDHIYDNRGKYAFVAGAVAVVAASYAVYRASEEYGLDQLPETSAM